ncbi:MAG: SGNH/GDSL hydrolase family protein, partial [Paramuribaculum sp.]|nr:SGNH/GDSL hydrolase family protein [Paramuribaculum sp.]
YYPGTEITVIVNSDMREDVAEALQTAARHYGAGLVVLHDIDKRSGHPTVKGMTQIAEQIAAYERTNARR